MITLKTLHQATEQQVYDHIVTHLRAQGAVCEDDDGRCAYRMGDLKCAAGCLIGDDEYSSDMENKGWGYLSLNYIAVPVEHRLLICSMQNIHDNENVVDWESGFRAAAKEFNLIYTEPQQ